MRTDAILSLIAEMKAKLANPDAGELTVELATLTLQSITPMLDCNQSHFKPIPAHFPTIQPAFHAWAMDALQRL